MNFSVSTDFQTYEFALICDTSAYLLFKLRNALWLWIMSSENCRRKLGPKSNRVDRAELKNKLKIKVNSVQPFAGDRRLLI